MKAPILKTWLTASVVLLLLAGAAYLYSFNRQIEEREFIFDLEKGLDYMYQAQLAESKMASEAYHFAATGRNHNKEAYYKERKKVVGILEKLGSIDLGYKRAALQKSSVNSFQNWMQRLDTVMERPFYSDSTILRSYMRSTPYVQQREQIFDQLTELEKRVVESRERRMRNLSILTKWSLIGFIAVMAMAVVLLIWTWRVNSTRMRMAFQLQLRQKDREFEVAFMQAPIGKIIVDQKGFCARVNRQICEMLGYDAATLESKRLADISPAHEYEEDLRVIAQLMHRQEKTNERDKEMLTASGQSIWVRQSMAFVSQEDGSPQQLIIQLKDITLEKESRRKLEESNVELEQFAYMASHDLKEPIRMIDGFMKLLEKNYGDRLDQTARKYVHFAADGAKRMNQLVDDLLQYSRATRQSGESENIPLGTLMEEIAKTYQPLMDQGSIDLHWQDLPMVRLPRAAIRTVLNNLVSNAIKYQATGNRPQIMVKADRVPGFWRISVVDNGIGIKSEFFDKIFIIFKRLHGKGEYEGSGIGLATCKRLVEKWGGRISVSSVEGEGSVFSFTIPTEPD